MRKHLTAILAAGVLVAGSGMAFAHSSFTQYETDRAAVIEGVVTTIDWNEPFSTLLIEGKGPNGRLMEYRVELGSTRALEQRGWRRDTIRDGDSVTITGWYARADHSRVKARTLEFSRDIGVGLTFSAATASGK
jgi:hypothetical protein